jgi:hypothetical protein
MALGWIILLVPLPDGGGVHQGFCAKLLTVAVGLRALVPLNIAPNFPGLRWVSPMRGRVGMLAAFAAALVAIKRAELGANVGVRPFKAGPALSPRASGV